jgi:outer membrane lipoprotein-sorting protein
MLSFAGYFENVNEFSAEVKEKSFYNKSKKEKRYLLKIEFPDKVYKEMFFPTLNAGEKYYYNGEKKLTYYPILEEIIEERIDEDENAILKTLRDIKKDNEKIVKIEKNGELEKIIYVDGYEVHFFQYTMIGNLNFPLEIKIYDNGYLITELTLENVKINEEFSFEELKLNE